jgi:single-stranded-DNA-specific exonuclease
MPAQETAWQVATMDREAALEMSRGLDISRLMAHLLLTRGVTSVEGGHRYFNPSPDHLSDPWTLTGMATAVDRIKDAQSRGESVMVFGDYDVDGISATALMVCALRRYGVADVRYDLPHRLRGGYGLNAARVKKAKEDGVGLVITVDNGITAYEAAEAAQEAGVDLIVTDHHSLGDTLPPACAVINPKRDAPDHPAANLAGVGVAFKLAHALTGEAMDLDLVALGTVADVVPLQGENRDLVSLGLKTMRDRPRVGLAELARLSKTPVEQVTSETISFQLGPRINAAGRLGDPWVGLDMLLTEDPHVASAKAQELDGANNERRAMEKDILAEVEEALEEKGMGTGTGIVLAKRGWHPGVLGIVASRLQRTHHQPALLIGIDEDGVGRGSARGVPACDLAKALAACGDHLVRHGGHRAAAGLTVEEDRIPAFEDVFLSELAVQMGEGWPEPTLTIDAQVSLSQIDGQIIRTMESLQPFGQGNPAPVLCTYGVEVLEKSVRSMNGGHVRMTVKEGPRIFNAVAFGMGHRFNELEAAQRLDIAFSVGLNTWRGETSIQLLLKDAVTVS